MPYVKIVEFYSTVCMIVFTIYYLYYKLSNTKSGLKLPCTAYKYKN